MRQHGGFAFTAIAILALSMASSVVAFSVVSQILERPLPYQDVARLVTVWERQLSSPGRNEVAPANFYDWRTRGRVHPVWIWGGLAMLASQLVMMAVMGSGWWHAFAEAMAAL